MDSDSDFCSSRDYLSQENPPHCALAVKSSKPKDEFVIIGRVTSTIVEAIEKSLGEVFVKRRGRREFGAVSDTLRRSDTYAAFLLRGCLLGLVDRRSPGVGEATGIEMPEETIEGCCGDGKWETKLVGREETREREDVEARAFALGEGQPMTIS